MARFNSFCQVLSAIKQSSVCPIFFTFGVFDDKISDKRRICLLYTSHNTRVRFANFVRTLEKDVLGRAAECKKEIDFVLKREELCGKLVDMLASGEMKSRVTHNDTKLNNVLLDEKTGKAVAVIDLDRCV